MRRHILTSGAMVAGLFVTTPTAQREPCTDEVTYVLAANLKVSDTPLGAGDGIYPIGPGTVVLRFHDRKVELIQYTMREHFTVEANALVWRTTVVTDTRTSVATTGAPAATGVLDDRTLHWLTPLRGYRTDGTLICRGGMCGSFDAPPNGTSELHIGPTSVWFKPFVFARDMQTFTMQSTRVSRTKVQSSEVALSGRETRRVCLPSGANPTQP